MQLTSNTFPELRWFARAARAPRLRPMLEFAESEIVIPDGPYEGRRFKCDRQPFSRLWFEAIDSRHWNRFIATGPVQSGKTLVCVLIPLLYHLFEICETVIFGIPAMEMASDKWNNDILPVIARSRYAKLLPKTGAGSKGGKFEAVRFAHGPTLKFMSGGGNDKKRAGFTSRVLLVTETDGMDQAGGASREADKIKQMEGRTRAFGRSGKRIYMECSVSIEQGKIWQEYTGGTRSRIALPCPHCGHYVSLEREHLHGWQDAQTELQALSDTHFYCCDCGEQWSEDDRRQANAGGRLVHWGQEITPEGQIVGEAPQTGTLGFRWSAVNNQFIPSGDVGVDEWKGARAEDEDNATKELNQYIWCQPYKPPKWEQTPLDARGLLTRVADPGRGIAPEDAAWMTAGWDLGKYVLHWLLMAWFADGRGHVLDYGAEDVHSPELGTEKAVLAALRTLRDTFLEGWPIAGSETRRVPDQVWVDSGWNSDVAYTFTRESGDRFRPSKGFGSGSELDRGYNRPTALSSTVKYIGEEYHFAHQKADRVHLVELNADHWKTYAHERLATPIGQAGAVTFYASADPNQHLKLTKHLTAEKCEEEFVAGKGMVKRWVRLRKANHWLDTYYMACAGGHFCGVRQVRSVMPAAAPVAPPPRPGFTTPDGRPFLITER